MRSKVKACNRRTEEKEMILTLGYLFIQAFLSFNVHSVKHLWEGFKNPLTFTV